MGTDFGVYIHIPFCARRCDYCAFATWTDRHHLQSDYLDAMRLQLAAATIPQATSVFVGGGTPSMVDPAALAQLIASIAKTDGAEVTVECNPDDVTADVLAAYIDGGVNRISLGVQSMRGHVLDALGRWHNPQRVVEAARVIADASAALRSWSVDVIYGAAGESINDWQATVDEVLALDPPHVSAYGLTVEKGTPLAADAARHPDDDDLADKYEIVDARLCAAGRDNYEVSNWSRPGHESVHNRLYWQQGEYLGVGCAAHSHRNRRRSWNVRTPERYIESVRAGVSVEAGSETLDDEAYRQEGLQLALRMRDGVPVDAFDAADLVVLDDLVVVAEGRVRLTRRGRLLANEVSLRLR